MQTSAINILSELRGAGLELTLDGTSIVVKPANKLTETDREMIRANKAALILALKTPPVDVGTIRPAGLSGKFLAVSADLDRQIAAQDLVQRELDAGRLTGEILCKFAAQHAPDPKLWGTAPIPDYTPTGRAKPQHWHHLDASWRPLARAYYGHQVNCKPCQSAGQGRGEPCPTGRVLWAAYQDFDKATP